jgi:hypothetical protein
MDQPLLLLADLHREELAARGDMLQQRSGETSRPREQPAFRGR